jgi:hypothetical protein
MALGRRRERRFDTCPCSRLLGWRMCRQEPLDLLRALLVRLPSIDNRATPRVGRVGRALDAISGNVGAPAEMLLRTAKKHITDKSCDLCVHRPTNAAIVLWSGSLPPASAIKVLLSRQACAICRDDSIPRA